MIHHPTVLGIVAEYDPFHNGHAHHLRSARAIVKPDAVYAVMSPCLKQRGEPAVFAPHERAACALHAGMDAVFALPVLWTVRDAEHYALGAVSLLDGLGITHLAFGAETADMNLLSRTADLLEDPPEALTLSLKKYLSDGTGYPAALCRAASDIMPETKTVLSAPNNILAVCYLRALRRLHAHVIPVVIPRAGGYHDAYVSAESPSASALRAELSRGIYAQVMTAVPAFTARMIRQSILSRSIPDMTVWNTLLRDCLLKADLSVLPDLSEGLDDALRKAAAAGTSQTPVEALASRRYPASRISRLCAYALLGVTRDRLDNLPLPQQTLLLALRKEKARTESWPDLPVRICTSSAAWKAVADPEDLRSWSLRASLCDQPDTLPFSEKIYTE